MTQEFNLDSLAGMSDEDFLSSPQLELDNSVDETIEDGEVVDEVESEQESTEEDNQDTEEEHQEEDDSLEDLGDEDSDEKSDSESDAEDENEETSEDNDNSDLDYKSELEKLFSPFSANNTEIKVDTVDEAIDLMRMGANYHKKMHILKPHLKFIKTLEKNELLDEDKINFLIDLSKGDKSAISKLISDGKIDPLDLDTEDVEYSPVKHTVSDSEINLDEVLESIKDTPSFKDTMDIITTQWDSSSKETLVANPQRIAVLNAHKASGLFDRINARVVKQRMLGKLDSNLSDVEAYELVGKALLAEEQANAPKGKPVSNKEVKAKSTPEVKDKKRRLSSPKSKPTPRSSLSIEELAKLPDEDFEKISNKYF